MENNENGNNINNHGCKNMFIIALMTFLGAFLAFYVLMHQTMFHFFAARHHAPAIYEKNFDKFKKDIEHDFKNLEKNETTKFKNKVSAVQTLKYDDAYVIVINLKPFNNNEDNIRFNLNGNTATVSGNVVKNKHNGESSYYFTESFEIPEKISVNEIQKEKINGKYIITLPIEN